MVSDEKIICNFNYCRRCNTSLKNIDGFVFQATNDVMIFCRYCAKLYSVKHFNYSFGSFVINKKTSHYDKSFESLTDLIQE